MLQKNKDDYGWTVTIDGLKRSKELRIGKQLRVASKKVHGARDESEPIIRLADSVAGLVRDTESDPKTYANLRQRLEKQGIITKL